MYDLSYEQVRVEHAEAIDYASRWGFLVYCRICPILGSKRAGETAKLVFAKILEQEGVPCQRSK